MEKIFFPNASIKIRANTCKNFQNSMIINIFSESVLITMHYFFVTIPDKNRKIHDIKCIFYVFRFSKIYNLVF